MLLLGMTTRLHGNRLSAPMSLRDSLTNLRALFLFTALVSNFLLHIIPQRRKSSVSGIHNIVKRPDDSRRPICFTLSNSLRQRRLPNVFTGLALPAVYRQSARRLRPFARRRFRTRRPPAVFILFLNPQVRRRLILEGWYVLFIFIPFSVSDLQSVRPNPGNCLHQQAILRLFCYN